jgi:hypothetical protein
MAATKQPSVRRYHPSLSRLWWGLVFVVAGVIGILAVAGVVDWNTTVGVWWPAALIGWAAAEMINARRLTVAGSVIVAIGLGLLAGNLDWPVRGLVWSALFLGAGVAILWGTRPKHVWRACRPHRSVDVPGSEPTRAATSR